MVVNIPESGTLSADGGLKYRLFMHVGDTATLKTCVLLVAEVNTDALEEFNGIVGTLFEMRGNSKNLLIVKKYNVTAAKAYDKFITESSDTNVKVGICSYNRRAYIAIRLQVSTNKRTYYSGLYSGSCLFRIVEENNIEWVE